MSNRKLKKVRDIKEPARAAARRVPAYDVDVVIVGAGFAGLAAADHFNRFNARNPKPVSFTALDADTRIGGRTSSVREDLGFLDVGGQYLTSPHSGLQPYLHELVKHFKVPLVDVEVDPDRLRVFESASAGKFEFKESTNPTLAPQLPPVSNIFDYLVKVEGLVDTLKPFIGRPWEAPNAAQLDQQSVQAWNRGEAPNPIAEELLTIGVQSAFSVEPRDISFLHFLHYGATCGSFTNYEINGESHRFEKGSRDLYIKIVESLPAGTIQRPQKVTHIVQDAQGVTVTTAQGMTLRARRAIVAMSPRASANIQWLPKQSPQRLALCDGAPTARTIKGFVIFNRAFWTPDYSGYVLSSVGPVVWMKEVIMAAKDGTAIPTLMLFIVGDHAEPWSRKTPDEKKQAIFNQLARTFDTTVSKVAACFREYVEQDWAVDPFAMGCPAGAFQPNVLTKLVNGVPAGTALAAPDGLVHFAGSETGTDWQGGYINGAVQSGQRAADEVIDAFGQGVRPAYAALVVTAPPRRVKGAAKRRKKKPSPWAS